MNKTLKQFSSAPLRLCARTFSLQSSVFSLSPYVR